MKQIKILLIMLLLAFQLNAQYAPSLINGFDANYINVNKNNFSPTNGTVTYDDFTKYFATSVNLTLKMHAKLMSLNGQIGDPNILDYNAGNIYNTPAYSYNRIIRANGLIVRKVQYTRYHISGNPDPNVRMLIIRPDDNVVRPCVMITNGANTIYTLNAMYPFYQTMIDLALRGYTVVFYECYSNDFNMINKLFGTDYPCCFNQNNNTIIEGEQRAYSLYQYGVASYNYIINDANLPINNRIVNANVNEIHTFGASLGSASPLMLAYSRTHNYPSNYRDYNYGSGCINTLSNNTPTRLCLNSNPTDVINIKSVIAGAGGMPKTAGDYFSTINGVPARTIPTLLIYGKNDALIKYDQETVGAGLPIISFDSLRRTLKQINKPNKLIVNCTGDHPFFRSTGILTYNPTDANFNLNNTQEITSTQFPGFIECININDTQDKYNNFSVEWICFRKYATQMLYAFTQITNANTIFTNFFKDIRTNNLGTYYNNNPQYIQTVLSYTCNLCFGLPNRCGAGSNNDGHFENSATCPIPTYKERSNTQFLRIAKPETETKSKGIISDEFYMYPNPANNEITINYASTEDKNIFIRVYNNLGVLLLNKNNKISFGENRININTTDLPNGIYLISIENEREIYSDKFIIQH